MNPRLLIPAIVLFFTFTALSAPPAEEMRSAANAFLASLSPDQRGSATFEFKSDERFNWDFVPRSRRGIPFKGLNPNQQDLGRALLRSGLSQQGYTKATNIITVIELVLREMEKQSARRDPGLYYVTLFGKPDEATWAWRIEGHHLSLNFTVSTNEVLAFSPSFFGSNPAEVPHGPRKGFRNLAAEEDLGRELATALSAEQRKIAVISETAPREIITGNSRRAQPLQPLGISFLALTESQRSLLEKLLREYLFRFRNEVAERDLEKIQKAGFEKIHFAWAGSLERGLGHYYRVQGPTFLLEYDNTQNNANHIHTVWRDLANDFGDDLLRRHYEHAPHAH